jgi:SAM-dependent methyltransferase
MSKDKQTGVSQVTSGMGQPELPVTSEDIATANRTFHAQMAPRFNETQPYFLQENMARVRIVLEAAREGAPVNSLLDLGCGTGFIIDLARDLFDRIIGVDITQEMLDRVTPGANIEIRLATADGTGEPSGAHGVVTAYGLLQHLHEYLPTFREAYRCLAPGGLFYADESQNFDCNEALRGLAGVAELSPLIANEVQAVVGDAQRYLSAFGLPEKVVETAMYQGRMRGGVKVEELVAALRDAGFIDIQPSFRWFVGRTAVQRASGVGVCAVLEEHLQSMLPLTRHLFKYIGVQARKPLGSS